MDEPDGHDIQHVLGLDLGQASDPSALTVTRVETPFVRSFDGPGDGHRQFGKARYSTVWIERFDLGTPYPEVVRRVAAVKRAPETGSDATLVMDATGVGRPVVDQFEEEGLTPVQVVFTSGDSVKVGDGAYRVPKADIATTVQSLLQTGRLSIAEGLDGAGVLVREMKRFRVKYSQTGHARFEHATEGDSDDVLLSLACVLWYKEHAPRASISYTTHEDLWGEQAGAASSDFSL